jgi:hypothetical protein
MADLRRGAGGPPSLEPHVRKEGGHAAGANEVANEAVVFRFVAKLAGDERGADLQRGRERRDSFWGADALPKPEPFN